MNNMNVNKSQINARYLSVIKMMEDSNSVEDVRNSLLEVASLLNALANTSIVDRDTANQKAKLLLSYAKRVREDNSYKDVYYLLTGNHLKENKITPKKEVKIDEEELLNHFNWISYSNISFKDVAGLDAVKEEIKNKVILPLTEPELFSGYEKRNGGGLLLYGPPGTGKTMIGAAIANELRAHFCSITPSDLLTTGVGNSEKLIKELFKEARSFDVAVIFFDEMESLCPKVTHSQVARQIRSELLAQIQGMGSYQDNDGKILYLIASTNKPWDVDIAFTRPGRFGTKVYVDLPDADARRYMITDRLASIKRKEIVEVKDIDVDLIVELTKGYSGADISYLLDEVQEISIKRTTITKSKYIEQDDFIRALDKVSASVNEEDIKKLLTWKKENNA